MGATTLTGGTPSWDKLYATGRCKYHGTPWSLEETKLIQKAADISDDERWKVIYGLRETYVDAHKSEIIDPTKKTREKSAARKELEEMYEVKFGKKPHHMASDELLTRRLSEQ